MTKAARKQPVFMAGPNVEIFKFGLYVFFPIAIMFHYGNPEWYEKHVLPVRYLRPFLICASNVYLHHRLATNTFLP